MDSSTARAKLRELDASELSRVGLALAWILAPAMRLDLTTHGADRAKFVEELLTSAFDVHGEPEGARQVADRVRACEELTALEEPDPPESYRTDVLSLIDYALRVGHDGDRQHVADFLGRFEDSVYFLQQWTGEHDRDVASDVFQGVVEWATARRSLALRGGLMPEERSELASWRAEVERLVDLWIPRA